MSREELYRHRAEREILVPLAQTARRRGSLHAAEAAEAGCDREGLRSGAGGPKQVVKDVAIFLYHRSGVLAHIWAAAGYTCYCVDVQHSLS